MLLNFVINRTRVGLIKAEPSKKMQIGKIQLKQWKYAILHLAAREEKWQNVGNIDNIRDSC